MAIGEAINLKQRASLPILEDVGVDQFANYQTVLKNLNIFVHSAQECGSVIFKRPILLESKNDLHILLIDSHYIAIKSMSALLRTEMWCRYCLRGCRKEHYCRKCQLCGSSKCQNTESQPTDYLQCNHCNRTFLSQECWNFHLVHSCDSKKKCLRCNKIVDASVLYNYKAHKCGLRYCRVCHAFVSLDHTRSCYTQPVTCSEKTDPSVEPILIFYDVESAGSEFGQHHPVLICAEDEFGLKKEFIGGDNKCVDHFMAWLGQYKKNLGKRDIAVLAHAGGFYDNIFILQYCYRNKIKVNVLIRSNRILLISFSNGIKFLDSFSFIPMKLSKIADCFQLSDKKGYCPFFAYNTDLSIKPFATGFFPDKKYFPTSSYTDEKERLAFERWYDEESKYYNDNKIVYPLIDKAIIYCHNDASLLKEACLKLRSLFRELTCGQNIFISITLTSAVWRAWRNLYLTENTLAYIPPRDYATSKNFSRVANTYLLWKSYELGWPIEFALTAGEKKIGPYFVDGFYREPNGKAHIFTFEGQFWHSTGDNINLDDLHLVYMIPHGENLQKMFQRHTYLREFGELHVLHETTWNLMVKNDKRIAEFVKNLDSDVDPLQPIDAVFGSRCENFALYHECSLNKGEYIAFWDINSLYPYINLITDYPTGHRIIIHGTTLKITQDWIKYYGVVKVKVLPPKDLYIPLLPCKIRGKLIFCLCKKCAEQCNPIRNSCDHSDEERSWTGTYTTPELTKAVSLGYCVLKVYQLYHFENRSKIFERFVKHFYSIKLEAQR